MELKLSSFDEDNFRVCCIHIKELYILTGMETFAKGPEFFKLLRELKSTPVRRYKKNQWFLWYVCNRKFAAFGRFAAE